MYVGRIVAIGRNSRGKSCLLYRVSSRSFPNRESRIFDGSVAIAPKIGFEHEIAPNPFTSYNCLRIVGDYGIVSNGSHTDVLALKLQNQNSIRDALVSVLHVFDFEPDGLSTPRIAAIMERGSEFGYLGIVTKQSLQIQRFDVQKGKAYYIATYEHNFPSEAFSDDQFKAKTAEDACGYILSEGVFADLERPVTAACAVEDESEGFKIAVANAR